LRALQKKKAKKVQQKKTAVAPVVKLVPHLPMELTKETRDFFKNQPRLKALLELVFSPMNPTDTEDDRREYEEANAEFQMYTEHARRTYEAHETRANGQMWRAIQQLPEDLYEEAIASKPEAVPDQLLFHTRHRDQIFGGLHMEERRRLQCYYNLMYLRYPHSEEKRRNPARFWIPENQVVSRQKEAAIARKKVTKAK